MTLKTVSLNDKYDLGKSLVFLSGIQALVRLPLMQKARDRGGRAQYRRLSSAAIAARRWAASTSSSGAREKLLERATSSSSRASTRTWRRPPCGAPSRPSCAARAVRRRVRHLVRQGSGVDRSRRRLPPRQCRRHLASMAACWCSPATTMRAESSTAAAPERIRASSTRMMPVLNPAGVQEILDYGLLGIAMSRFSGAGSALKCVHDTVEIDRRRSMVADRVAIVLPAGFQDAAGRPQHPLAAIDARWSRSGGSIDHKRFAALAFARANRSTGIVFDGGRRRRLGIVTTGKCYLDVRQALDELGIDEVEASRARPAALQDRHALAARSARRSRFRRRARAPDRRRGEALAARDAAASELLYNGRERAPVVIGKKDEDGNRSVPGLRHARRRTRSRIAHRRTPAGARADDRAARANAWRQHPGAPGRRSPSAGPGQPHALFLRRLPA